MEIAYFVIFVIGIVAVVGVSIVWAVDNAHAKRYARQFRDSERENYKIESQNLYLRALLEANEIERPGMSCLVKDEDYLSTSWLDDWEYKKFMKHVEAFEDFKKTVANQKLE